MAGTKGEDEKKFGRHSKADAAIAPPKSEDQPAEKLTFLGRIAIFLLFPSVIGVLGLYMGYLAKRNDPSRELSFDTDFALPFVVALTMVLVIGFQTRGFSSQPKPIIKWPKVKKHRKIVHKHVVKGQNIDEVEDSPTGEIPAVKDDEAKKNE